MKTINNRNNHDKLLMKRQFKTIAINIIDVIILFVNSSSLYFFPKFLFILLNLDTTLLKSFH